MAAKLSDISASFIRASLPFFIRPVRCVTPINVPALSNTSMNRIENTTIRNVSSHRRKKSSCKSVGAIDGGIETTPVNFASPNGKPMIVATRIPIKVAPRTRLKLSAAMRTKPSSIRTASGFLRSPSVTSVAG